MVPQKRRTSTRTQESVHGSVRFHSGGVVPLTVLAIVAALGFVLAGGRAGLVQPATPRTGPVINSEAAPAGARAAVPGTAAAIPDRPWLVQSGDGRWAYGHGTRRAPHWLPDDETGLAIGGRWVASVIPGADGHSTVRLRERGNDRVVADVVVPIWASAGAFAQAGLVVTGYGDWSMTTDGGLLLISPIDASTSVVVPSGPFSPALGSPAARGGVLVSPSGTRVASNACGLKLCDTQVVDLATATVSRPIQGGQGFLRALTDETIVTTDDDFQWISARRIGDGSEVWRQRDSVLLAPVAGLDGSVVGVVGSARTGWGVVSIDAAGHVRDLTPRSRGRQPWPRIWTEFSTGSLVIVGGAGFADTVGTDRSVPVSIVAVKDGVASTTSSSVRLPAATEPLR